VGERGLNSLQVARGDNCFSNTFTNGQYLYDEGKKVDATTLPTGLKSKWADIRVAPDLFRSQRMMYLQLGHEFVHVDQIWSGQYWSYKDTYKDTWKDLLESEAYWWNIKACIENGWDYRTYSKYYTIF
jgi:hypothetical protein